ncbi:MAG: winged helix-turn-helix domain-containing protein [Thermoproteota archaeon]|nr:winged helix-turn-helix domain-containing protein [Thermoproteota archaeon]
MKYRDRTEIITLILASASRMNGVLKTKIMYEAFLSFSQVEEYIALLLQNSLLEHDDLKKTYKTTEKGLRLLELCNSITEIVDTKKTKKDEKNSVIV